MDIKDQLPEDLQQNFEKDILCLPKILNCSPAGSTIDGWVDCLATDQTIIVAHKVKKAKYCFLQCDHAPDGSLAKVLTYFDVNDKTKTADGSVQQFFLGVEVTGKKSVEIAEGIVHSFGTVLGLQHFTISGITNDSGGGTPESLYNALLQMNCAHPDGSGDSCGHHDLQSVFRLPIQQYIGLGGLEKRDALQLAHAVFDLFKCFRELQGNWKEFVTVIWNDQHPNTDVPKELVLSIQEPLLTRWWTVGKVCQLIVKYYQIIQTMALSVVAATKTNERENKIASGLASLMNEPMIHADLLFLAAFSKHFLDDHMKWYGSKDDNIGVSGFLIFHRFLRYYIMQQELKNLESNGWETNPVFGPFLLKLQTLTLEEKNMKILMANQFLLCASRQTKNTMSDMQ